MTNKCTEKAEMTCKSYPNCYGCNAYRNPTNYDRIKNMSIDEMANILCKSENCEIICVFTKDGKCIGTDASCCVKGVKLWLESEVG